jgi:hypothetical protein
MRELMIDVITSLDGCASARGWPAWWGLAGPEYLAWLEEQPEATLLMGATSYRRMSGFAGGAASRRTDAASGEVGADAAEEGSSIASGSWCSL